MKAWIEKGEKYVLKTYNRFPIVIESGSGVHVYDMTGKRYIDMMAGIAVNSLGYAHPKLTTALKNQVDQLLHISNLYYTRQQVEVAEKIIENSPFDKVFFCNSGAEANEAAIKLARKYGKSRGSDKVQIITMKDSFHGRTYGAMTATGQLKYQESFTPLVPEFQYVAFNDIKSLEEVISHKVCAVMLEVIQGEGGIKVADIAYLKAVQKLCKEYDAMLIVDEVQTGIGRLGSLFGFEQFGIEPDVVTMAKGLGSGMPIGAMACKKEVAAFVPGDHASTFGGNPLATVAAKVVLEELLEEHLIEKVQQVSVCLTKQLERLVESYSPVVERRGMGLMQGIELNILAAPIINECLKKGVLLVAAGSHVIRFVPPLIIKEEEILSAIKVLEDVLKSLS